MADDGEQLGLATGVTIAWLSNPHTRAQADDVSTLLGSVLTALRGLGEPSTTEDESAATPEYTPAVTARRSLASPDRIVSMIDGKPYGSLKRHLRAHGLTPDEYRQRYGLKPEYPMVAPGYSAARSAAAKQHGFGRKSVAGTVPELVEEAVAEPAAEVAPQPAKSGKRPRQGISGVKQTVKAHLGGEERETESGPV